MSSSNAVRLALIEESSYGVTPGAGNFKTARFISESLSGTPDTVESQQIRTDRMSSGQIVTGLKVGGDMGFELAKEAVLELLMASAMLSTWQTQSLVTADLTIDISERKLTRATGDWSSTLKVGDFLTLAGFSTSANNVVVQITEVTDAKNLLFVGPEGMADEVGSGTTYKRADKLSIGTTKKSFTVEKAFTDLTTKAIIYKGMLVNTMELNVAFGDLVGGKFGFVGNDYDTVSAAADFATHSRTIDDPATTNTFNGSIDMPFLISSAGGATLDESAIDIQSVSLTLNNNNSPQNVIGNIAPKNYSPGTAGIEISLNAYLTDAAWAILGDKLTQASFALGFMVKNGGGWYGFYMPAIQVSFDDPASGGQNQDLTLDMSGKAKVGSAGESALTIYRPS